MDESLRGYLITATVALIFITCILNFIILFPQEQGIVFSDPGSQAGYLAMGIVNNTGTQTELSSLSNSTGNAFNQWDVTQGFMGSNQMKQGQTGVISSITQVFSTLIIIAKQLFTANSPIVYALTTLMLLAGIVVIWIIYKFVRTGN